MTTNNESNLSLELAWAKVLLKSCLDVLETHNETIVKRLRNDVSDFLKDDYNLLKNQKKFNISEGNVKMDNTFSNQKREENNTFGKTNVAQQNSQDLERVADTSKTIIVGKEVYEAVLRNSLRVCDLEKENEDLISRKNLKERSDEISIKFNISNSYDL